jgi:hypothetical protein
MKMPQLCLPAMVYLVLAVISLSIMLFARIGMSALLMKILFVGFYTWFLNLLCKKGYETISWILVVLPYLVMFGVVAVLFEFANRITQTLGKSLPVTTYQVAPSMPQQTMM